MHPYDNIDFETRIDIRQDPRYQDQKVLEAASSLAYKIYTESAPDTDLMNFQLDGKNHWAVMWYSGTPMVEKGLGPRLWLELYDGPDSRGRPERCHFTVDLRWDLIHDKTNGYWPTLHPEWKELCNLLKEEGRCLLWRQHIQWLFEVFDKRPEGCRDKPLTENPEHSDFGIKNGLRVWGKHVKDLPWDLARNPIRPGTPRPSRR